MSEKKTTEQDLEQMADALLAEADKKEEPVIVFKAFKLSSELCISLGVFLELTTRRQPLDT